MYSIWLLPDRITTERFQKIIEALSEMHQSPQFLPHITLLAGIESIDDTHFYKLSVLAALTQVFDVTVGELCQTNDYFKALYLNIDTNETLHNLQSEIACVFLDVKYEFLPHLSLLYKHLNDEQLHFNQLQTQLSNIFQARNIVVVKTAGKVEDWKVIDAFQLHHKDDINTDELMLNLNLMD